MQTKERSLTMKVRLNGNVATIVADINFEDLEKYTKKEPIAVRDEKGNIVFAVQAGSVASITRVGATFTHKTADGKAAMNLMYTEPVTKGEILDRYEAGLALLRATEESINSALEALKTTRADLAETIVEE